MIAAGKRAVALLAATATAATLAGVAPHTSAPSTTWQDICPDARVRVTEAPGWEGLFEAHSNPDKTCTVVQNTSTGVLRVAVQPPDSVVFLDGDTVGVDPREPVLAQVGAVAAGKRYDTDTQQPVLPNGYTVIQHRPGATWWTQVADQSTQVKVKYAVELTKLGLSRVPWTRWAGEVALLDAHIQRCAILADALHNQLLAEGRPATFEVVFEQLPETVKACKPVYDAAKPPRPPTNPLDTPQGRNSRRALQQFNSVADDLLELQRLGRALITIR
jgi:hypothetical protein